MSSAELQVPIETRPPVTIPMWATMKNAATALGNEQWDPQATRRIEAPPLYRDRCEHVEPMRERIVEEFRHRRTPQQFAQALTGMYETHDSLMDSHQWRLIEQCKYLLDDLSQKRAEVKRTNKRTARAKLVAEATVDVGWLQPV